LNEQTLLLRQINPSWCQNGRVTSQAFKPTKKDNKRLSVYNGDLIDAAAAWRHYTTELKFQSVGALAVAGFECAGLDLRYHEDPEPFPEHAVVDFSPHSNSQIETKAKLLLKKALDRGWLYEAS
jgi:hypothetical protein